MSVIFFRIPSHTPAVVSHSLWIRVPSDEVPAPMAAVGPHSCQSRSRTSCKSDRKGPKTAGIDLLCRLCRCLSFCAIR
jgi:hypothetical protein